MSPFDKLPADDLLAPVAHRAASHGATQSRRTRHDLVAALRNTPMAVAAALALDRPRYV